MEVNTSVLDDADDETVALIIQLQLCDLTSAMDGRTDHDIATALYKAELEDYKILRGLEDKAVDASVEYLAVQDPPFSSIQLLRCNSCLDHFTAEGGYEATCRHFYCDADLSTLFQTAMHDRSFYPPKCCGSEIKFDEVRFMLDKGLASEFAERKPELDDDSPVYCSSRTCSSYIPRERRAQDTVECACGTTTCTSCKAAAHTGDCPADDALLLTLALAEREGWRRCNECKRLVELSMGCYHMTCICHAQFCYLCGERWKSCGCIQFEEHRLRERADEVLAQLGGRRGAGQRRAMMNHLRENHECDHRSFEHIEGRHRCEACEDVLREYIFRCRRCFVLRCRRCRYNR